ncbi:hypothetical protein D3C76_950790 [compost metagenome]
MFADTAYDGLAVSVHVIDHDDALAEAFGNQAFVHHLQRRMLLTDDEQAALAADGVGDHVDDGLALAGSGRPLDQQPRALSGLDHGRFLRGVAGHGEVTLQLAWRCLMRGFVGGLEAQRRFKAGTGGRQGFQLT